MGAHGVCRLIVGAVVVGIGTHSQRSRVTLGSRIADDVGYRHAKGNAKGNLGSPQFHKTLGGSPSLLLLRCYVSPLLVSIVKV